MLLKTLLTIALYSCWLQAFAQVNTTTVTGGGIFGHADCTEIIQFNDYSETTAQSSSGQHFFKVLQSGYILEFDLAKSGEPMYAAPAPCYAGASFGSLGYIPPFGTSNLLTLYQTANDHNNKLVFTNMKVHDAANNPITPFTLVFFDSETMGVDEITTLTVGGLSSHPWEVWDDIVPTTTPYNHVDENTLSSSKIQWEFAPPLGSTSTIMAGYEAHAAAITSPGGTTSVTIDLNHTTTTQKGFSGIALGIRRIMKDTTITICSGEKFNVVPQNAVAGTTYTWTVPTGVSPNIIGYSDQTTAVTSISQTLKNTGNTPGAIGYYVTPVSCGDLVGKMIKVTVIVNPNNVAVMATNTCATDCDGSIKLNTSSDPLEQPLSYTWNDGSTFPYIKGCEGLYNVTVTNAYGCKTAFTDSIEVCGCKQYVGTSTIVKNEGSGYINFTDNTSYIPDFINWYVDGVKDTQTIGNGTFQFNASEHTVGTHVICLEAAHLITLASGETLCCYDRTCDTLKVDSCDVWRATDTITYTLDSTNYHHVTLNYSGHMDYLTILWDFHDGSPIIANAGEVIEHDFASSTNVCAYIVWSDTHNWTPDSPGVCCCLDTICFNVDIDPCAVEKFNIVKSEDPDGDATFTLSPSFSGINLQDNLWTISELNGMPIYYDNTGSSFTYVFTKPLAKGNYLICSTYKYKIGFLNPLTNKIDSSLCGGTVCDTFSLGVAPVQSFIRYFPTPSHQQVTVEIKSAANDNARIDMIDNMGRMILSRSYSNLAQGFNQITVDVNRLTPGVYSMKVTIGNQIKVVKLVKN